MGTCSSARLWEINDGITASDGDESCPVRAKCSEQNVLWWPFRFRAEGGTSLFCPHASLLLFSFFLLLLFPF